LEIKEELSICFFSLYCIPKSLSQRSKFTLEMIISNLNKKALICWRRHNRKLFKLNLRHTELRDIRAGEVVEDYANYVFGHTPWANYYM
jgi:hypothetical protein